jgi:hypothetical protein
MKRRQRTDETELKTPQSMYMSWKQGKQPAVRPPEKALSWSQQLPKEEMSGKVENKEVI